MAVAAVVGSMVAVAAGSVVVAAVVFVVVAEVDSAVVVSASPVAGSDMEEDLGTGDSDTASGSVLAWGIGADMDGPIITDLTDIHITATLIPTMIIPTLTPLTIRVRR